jgi:hypothetical protein
LGEPYTRQLDGKRWELRFHLDGRPFRVTSWIASGRRIVLLTVFARRGCVSRSRWIGLGGRWHGAGRWSTRWRTAMVERESWSGLRDRRT